MEFSGSNEEGRGVGSYIRGVTPVARGGTTGPPVARGGATGPPAARGLGLAAGRPLGGDRAFFFQGPHCEFEQKKLHLRLVALWEGDRGLFLKYFKTDIYF